MLDLEETLNLVDLPSRGNYGSRYRPVPVCPPLAFEPLLLNHIHSRTRMILNQTKGIVQQVCFDIGKIMQAIHILFFGVMSTVRLWTQHIIIDIRKAKLIKGKSEIDALPTVMLWVNFQKTILPVNKTFYKLGILLGTCQNA